MSHGPSPRPDEAFVPTNDGERRRLDTLRENWGIVFATTQDAELQEMLADVCTMFHFGDRVDGDGYDFGYRIRPGPARSRNAIRLLEFSGYPATITQEAERLAALIEAKRPPAGSSPTPASSPPVSDTLSARE